MNPAILLHPPNLNHTMSVIGMRTTSLRRMLAMAALVLATSTLASARPAHAQSAQPYSLQLAALFNSFEYNGVSIGGTGVEPQFRFNRLYSTETFGALSLGIGGQFTSHARAGSKFSVSGLFLEPRWVPAIKSKRVFPYLSARLAALRQTNNFSIPSSSGTGFGAGGGLAIKITKSTNLDAGVQLVRQKLGEFDGFTTYTAKAGVSVGFPR